MDWSKILETSTPTTIVAFVVIYVFARLIPARDREHSDSMALQRKDHLDQLAATRSDFMAQLSATRADFMAQMAGARTDFMAQMDSLRESYLVESQRVRDFYKGSYESIVASLAEMSDKIDRISKCDYKGQGK